MDIDPRYVANFNQHISDAVDIGEYDYDSVMHYHPLAFTRNGKPTIISHQRRPFGRSTQLSVGDIVGVRARLNSSQRIVSRHTRKALAVDGSHANGAAVIQCEATHSGDQRWRLVDAGSGAFYLSSESSGMVLDLAVVGSQPSKAQMWQRNAGPNQMWRIVPVMEQYFCLVSVTTGRALDTGGTETKDGSSLVDKPVGDTTTQQWSFKD